MLLDNVNATVEYIRTKTSFNPKAAVILGSGLGAFAEEIEDAIIIPYEEIPGFVVSTAPGHNGRRVIGKMAGKEILCMQGRFHYFEGYSMKSVVYPIRVMKMLGIEKLIVTNSCGGIDLSFKPGDLMVIEDHINLLGNNPLIGPNEEEFGVRFTDMTEARFAGFIEEFDGLQIEEQWISTDVRPGRGEEQWLNIILRKWDTH
mgnify:CR=1 FL=1